MLIVHHIRVDDLEQEDAFAIAGPPNTDRAKLAAKLLARGLYDAVARIDLRATSHGLETAYTVTQNLEAEGWSRKPPFGLEPLEPVQFFDPDTKRVWGRRSTMVGDVIEYSEGGKLRSRHVVDWAGFAEIPLLEG